MVHGLDSPILHRLNPPAKLPRPEAEPWGPNTQNRELVAWSAGGNQVGETQWLLGFSAIHLPQLVLDGHHRVLICSHFEEYKLCSGSAKASAWHLMEISHHFLRTWVG